MFAETLFIVALFFAPSVTHANPVEPVKPDGWEITVYYTAVESFHRGKATKVQGCLESGCEKMTTLGSYPSDFVQAVHDEGTGRITSGPHAGKYLCWSSGSGYWLDTVPKNSLGTALLPWISAAADPKVMDYGKSFKIADCGTDDTGGGPIDDEVCAQLKKADWTIMDRFEPGLGGSLHLDLYIGEEDQENFIESSPRVISVKAAVISRI